LKNYPILLQIRGFVNGGLVAYFVLYLIFTIGELRDTIKEINKGDNIED